MTTIIVVAIVALVFFVTVSVVAFMVWKQETKMKTDSLRGIEHSLNEVLNELTAGGASDPVGRSCFCEDHYDELQDMYTYIKNGAAKRVDVRNDKDKNDPFSWVRTEETEDLKVFKPDEPKAHKLKWIEVTAEDVNGEESDVTCDKAEKPEEIILNGSGDQEHEEISLSFIDSDEFDSLDIEDLDFFENLEKLPPDYDRGRSGRKYTAEELESLIKE